MRAAPIQLIDVSKSFDGTSGYSTLRSRFQKKSNGRQVLSQVSLNVFEGEILGVAGSNGAGKSTLLRIIAGITAPTSGRVQLKGRTCSVIEVLGGFHPEMTGRETISLYGLMSGFRNTEIAKVFEKIVSFSELEGELDKPIREFSSGMLLRLALSSAMHLGAEILLFDEVLSVVDENFQKKTLKRLIELKNNGSCILLVSHDAALIQKLCCRVATLQSGAMHVRQALENATTTSPWPAYFFDAPRLESPVHGLIES